ncbi:MAG TPA: hypothetical protein VGR48_18360, partial [Terriglobales bacterium]|nr:hypothetical protein [Terriglobales bacterium]
GRTPWSDVGSPVKRGVFRLGAGLFARASLKMTLAKEMLLTRARIGLPAASLKMTFAGERA